MILNIINELVLFVINFLIHNHLYLFAVMCLKVFKKRTPVIIFGCNRNDVTGDKGNRKGVTGDRGNIFHEEFTS